MDAVNIAKERIREAKEEDPMGFFRKYNKHIHFAKFDAVYGAYLLLAYGEYNDVNYSTALATTKKQRMPQITRHTIEEWHDCSYHRGFERWLYMVEMLHNHVAMEYELLYQFMD